MHQILARCVWLARCSASLAQLPERLAASFGALGAARARFFAALRPRNRLFRTKSERNSEVGMHEQTDLVELCTIYYDII